MDLSDNIIMQEEKYEKEINERWRCSSGLMKRSAIMECIGRRCAISHAEK